MKLDEIDKKWDLIIVGGGVTGAGILREAIGLGLRSVLLEQNDFAWGTSSRSSKLVHGGLRYLKQAKFMLTLAAVKERQHLLSAAPGLVEPLGFSMPVYRDRGPHKGQLRLGLAIYSLMAGEKQHSFASADELLEKSPHLTRDNLVGGFRYLDAAVDDARLVQRLINESVARGASALNYTAVQEIVRTEKGHVRGVVARDTESNKERELKAEVVINATGAWASKLHPIPRTKMRLRPLRGSHLVFPAERVPLTDALSFFHPDDSRPIFAIPWEGATILGTTDMDHGEDLSFEPMITDAESDYLLKGIDAMFPALGITRDDCISTMSGVRPVLSTGERAPSKESREHAVWSDKGLVTVTGGKLTTFRKIAWDTLRAARPFFPSIPKMTSPSQVFSPRIDATNSAAKLAPQTRRRLFGRYGAMANRLIETARPEELDEIPGTQTLWAELHHAAKHEQIKHLADLLLRRVRIGLLLPEGGAQHLNRIEEMTASALPWDKDRWQREKQLYVDHWKQCYAPPRGSA